MESRGPDVDAGTPEEELNPIKPQIPAECVPETSPTRTTAPVQPGARRLGRTVDGLEPFQKRKTRS